jgi:hypothetical protein
MKKMIFASVLLILILAGTLLNLRYLNHYIGELQGTIAESRKSAEAGDFSGAEEQLWKAIDRWKAAESYTHIFIRHSELDSATDAFYDLLRDLYAQDRQSAMSSYEKVNAHLSSINNIERVRLGSIF